MKAKRYILWGWIMLCGMVGMPELGWGQCVVSQLPGTSGTPVLPVDLVQVMGVHTQTDGALCTQIWHSNSMPPACCGGGTQNPIQSRFDRAFNRLDTNNFDLPLHRSGNLQSFLSYKGVGVNTQNPIPNFTGNLSNTFEQIQQDGWLIIPPGVDNITFKVGSPDIQGVAFFISNDSTKALNESLEGMQKILEDEGFDPGGDTVCWIVPDSLPTFGPQDAFRYARIRLYHYDRDGDANSTVEWDIGGGLEPIHTDWFQSVSGPNRVDNAPDETVLKCRFAYRDRNGSLFPVVSAGVYGLPGRPLDPRRLEEDSLMFSDVLLNAFPPNFSCPASYSWVKVVEFVPKEIGKMYVRVWEGNAFQAQGSTQVDYLTAFNATDTNNYPIYIHPAGPKDTISLVTGLGSDEASFGALSAGNPFQAILDGWLAVPPKVACIPFQVGGSAHTESSALWAGMDYDSLELVAAHTGAGISEGSYCLPFNPQNDWRWLRVRLYIYDQSGNHNTFVKWDLGRGFEEIPKEFIREVSNGVSNSVPGPDTVKLDFPLTYYGLRDARGRVWQAAGSNPPGQTFNFRDNLASDIVYEEIYPPDSGECASNAPPPPGAGLDCAGTLASDPCNQPPSVPNDTFRVVKDVGKVLDVLRNATDPNPGDSIFIRRLGGFQIGGVPTLAVNGQQIHYQPATGFTGQSIISFRICDYRPDSLPRMDSVLVIIEEDSDGDQYSDGEDEDDDNDGIPDVIENAYPDEFADFDGDGLVNRLDLDSDNDGIPDIVEGGVMLPGGDSLDPDGDGRVALFDTTTTLLVDSNQDGWADDAIDYGKLDSDGDSIPDFLDRDSDNDGLFDLLEVEGAGANGAQDSMPKPNQNGWFRDISLSFYLDHDGDSVPARLDIDSDNDGIPNYVEEGKDDDQGRIRITPGSQPNEFGVIVGGLILQPKDTDGDGEEDYLDLDSDDDGIPDVSEAIPFFSGQPREWDLGVVEFPQRDDDGDGLADTVQTTAVLDSDGDGVPDFQDLDSDNDGIYDIAEEGWTLIDTLKLADSGKVYDIEYILMGWDNRAGLIGNFDSDLDSVPDRIDLDSDNDGIPDIMEAGSKKAISNGRIENLVGGLDAGGADTSAILHPPDKDKDGVPDYLDIDSDQDGILDAIEAGGDPPVEYWRFINGGEPGWVDVLGLDSLPDHDEDGVANSLDLDSDNDGIPDIIESGRLATCDSTAAVQPINSQGDLRLDGFPEDYFPGRQWLYSDGWLDSIPFLIPVNTDSLEDDIPDYLDSDSDGDGLPDALEAAEINEDKDGDGFVDYKVGELGWLPGKGIIKPLNTDAMLYPPGTPGWDTLPDFRDLNSDGDNLTDQEENELAESDSLDKYCKPGPIPRFRDPKPCIPTFVQKFSPNGDGTNDQFKIWGLEYYPENIFTVYTRWGSRVFEAKNYSSEEPWVGESNEPVLGGNGKLPEGIYYYTFIDTGSPGGARVLKKGFIYISK